MLLKFTQHVELGNRNLLRMFGSLRIGLTRPFILECSTSSTKNSLANERGGQNAVLCKVDLWKMCAWPVLGSHWFGTPTLCKMKLNRDQYYF
jgi:hypothetical protein